MGTCYSYLSDQQKEVLRHSMGMKAEELRPLFPKIPVYVFKERSEFQNHAVPSIAFLVVRGEYIISTKSVLGGKSYYYI